MKPFVISSHSFVKSAVFAGSQRLALGTVFILAWFTTLPAGFAAVNRAVQLQLTRHPTRLEIRWTPKSALPGDYHLFPEYQLQVSTNLVDWRPVGASVRQRLGGAATPITRFITNGAANRLFVRVVDRLDLHGDWFSQLTTTNFVVDVRGADLRGANMDDALLGGVYRFDDANLSHATLRRTAFGYGTFRRVNFTAADVSSANFYGTDLTDANFTRTDAREAIFGAANLTNINFDHANLRDARSFDDTAPGLRFRQTIMPDGSMRGE